MSASDRAAQPLANTRGREDLVAGLFSGVTTRMVVAPLDVLKIRYQLQDTAQGQRLYTGLVRSAAKIVRDEGVAALWKGNVSAVAMSSVYAATAFATNQQVKKWLVESNRTSAPVASLVSGSAAGVAATLTSYPLDLLRTRFASQKESIVRWNAQGVSSRGPNPGAGP